MEAVVKVHTLPRRAVRGGAAREAKAAPNLEGSALATRESQVEVGDVEGRRRLLPERGWWEEVCVRHPCGEVWKLCHHRVGEGVTANKLWEAGSGARC